jgi:formate hydrogenlyase subunit 6/NADH:ubiquinone oxidoreductase subunit I
VGSLSFNNKFLIKGDLRKMAYVITDECIACGSCEDECPVEAISEGEDKYVIDAKLCNDCGACADQCPVESIVPGEEK